MKTGKGARTGTTKSPAKKAVGSLRAAPPSKVPSPTARAKKPVVRIFVSYGHTNAAAQEKLQIHLAQLKRDEVQTWFDGDMHAGDRLDTEISRKLRAAHVFVALISPEYRHSHWCQLEYKRARGPRARNAMRVVVVIVRPCDWKVTAASELKVLPRDGRPISGWRTADDAFNDVTQGLRGAVRAVRAAMTEGAQASSSSPRRPAGSKKPAAPAKRPSPGQSKERPSARKADGSRSRRNRVAS